MQSKSSNVCTWNFYNELIKSYLHHCAPLKNKGLSINVINSPPILTPPSLCVALGFKWTFLGKENPMVNVRLWFLADSKSMGSLEFAKNKQNPMRIDKIVCVKPIASDFYKTIIICMK